jgi:subtilase family serine protease
VIANRSGREPALLTRFGLSLLVWMMLLTCAGAPDAQDMVKLIGNHPTGIAGQPTGSIAPEPMLTMMITLKVRDPEALNRLLSEQQNPSSPDYQRWLTPQEFSTRFGPDPAQFKAVRDWLVAQGFEVTSSSVENRSITFRGSAGQAERIFRTKIVTYAGDSYANVTDPSIPAQFAGVIGAIGGLDNVVHAVPASTR